MSSTSARAPRRAWSGWLPGALVFVLCLWALLASAPGRDHFLTDDDHGFQLCLGLQVLHGKTPGVDTYNAYGPLVVYASALARAWSGSLFGEALLCSLSWALVLTLVFVLVRRHASLASAALAVLAGSLLQARFYKWYLWLWPLAALLALERALDAPRDRRLRRSLELGAVLGLGWLHRLDVGTLCILAAALVLLVHGRRALLAGVAAGCAAPLALWMGFLALHEGLAAPLAFLRSTLAGAMMAREGMGTDWPVFDLAHPLGPASARVLAYALLALAYGGWSVSHLVRLRRGRATPRTRFLFACACLGAAVVHQALHRRDGQHLLQVLAPAIVGGLVWADGVLRSVRPSGAALRRAAPALLLLGLALAVGAALTRWGRVDLQRPVAWPVERLRRLTDPLQGSHPLLRSLVRLRELVAPDEALLVFPLWPQAYVFAERRMSGKLHGYYPGVFDRPPWSAANLAELQRDPPRAVLVTPDFLGRPAPQAERYARYRAAHPAVDAFVRERYPHILYEDRVVVLLGPEPVEGRPWRR